MTNTKHLFMPENHMEDLYKSKNPLVKFVHVQRLRNTLSLVPYKAKVILDVGCGEGQLLEYLNKIKGRELYGVDVLSHVVYQARKRVPTSIIVQSDGCKMKFKNNTFDVVTCIDVLEHIPNWRDVIKEIIRVTKPGGIIVLGWPNDDNWNLARFLLGKGPVPDHINILTPRIVRQAMNRKSIKIKRIPLCLPWKFCLTTQESYIK